MPSPCPTRGPLRPNLCATFGLLAAWIWLSAPPAWAQNAELPRKDRLGILYSNQVIFDRHGQPLVSVRVTEAQEQIRLRSQAPLVVMPGADEGTRLRTAKGADWTVRLEEAHPGQVRWWVVAERLPAHELRRAAARRAHWQEQGHEVQIFESGALIGLGGQTLDTRQLSLAIAPQPTKALAQRHAASLHQVLGELIDEHLRRPSAWLVAREAHSGVELRARDLIWFSPEGDHSIELPDMEWGHGTPKSGRQTRRYKGDLYLAVGNDARLVAVNLLSAERLLQGVVPSELYPSAPEEALKAQAVAARGQLLAKVGTRHRADPYLLCAETHCQVYRGETQAQPRTDRAIAATHGELLFDEHGLVDTVYSSSCGGHSEAFHLFWGGDEKPALLGSYDRAGEHDARPIDDPAAFIDAAPEAWCSHNEKLYRWQKKLTGAAVSQAVERYAREHPGEAGSQLPVGAVHRIEVLRRGASGRALAVAYHGATGRYLLEGEYKNRTLLHGLRSGLWVVERRGGAAEGAPHEWIFRGGGFGHGVGLCQHGSIGQAKAGRSYEAILQHYYRGGQLRKAW